MEACVARVIHKSKAYYFFVQFEEKLSAEDVALAFCIRNSISPRLVKIFMPDTKEFVRHVPRRPKEVVVKPHKPVVFKGIAKQDDKYIILGDPKKRLFDHPYDAREVVFDEGMVPKWQ